MHATGNGNVLKKASNLMAAASRLYSVGIYKMDAIIVYSRS